MIPVILVARGRQGIDKFLASYQKEQGITDSHVIEVVPEGKEFGIAQVKSISRDMAYGGSSLRLYVLHDFDTASAEAQNAFLKTLEEHPTQVGFVMIVARRHALLPTIASRSRLVDISTPPAPDVKVMAYFESIIKRPAQVKIGDELVDMGSEAARRRVFMSLLLFFKDRLPMDPQAPAVLTEALRTFNLVSRNNVNAQNALDHLMLFVRKIYTSQPKDLYTRSK